MVIASFSDPNAVAGGEVTLLPKGVTFVGYAKVFANHRIWQGYLNTIIYSVVGTAVNMAVTIPCAFALSAVSSSRAASSCSCSPSPCSSAAA